ncbi:MAG TPA: thioesterase family protein [Pirellulales bacterium]|jgi:acyl-CoA thioester hydrolase
MDSTAADLLEGFHVVLTVAVQWGDQDSMQHVNNVIYFRWCESARIEYFQKIGLLERRHTEGVGPILASIKCDFRRQLNFPDTVRIGARIARIGRSSVTMEHRIVSTAQNVIAAEAESTMVVFDYRAGKSHPVPDELRAAIEQIEGRKF